MTNASYAQTAQGIATTMQRYAAQRHPYERAADEIELAVLAAHVHAAKTQAAAAASSARHERSAGAGQEEL